MLPVVHADGDLVCQVLVGLLSNAVEATPAGGEVVVRARATNGTVELAVADGGAGIAPELRARVFEPFFTTRPNGTGLGVVLAQGVITQHGGSLAYVSTVGKGTTAKSEDGNR